MRVSEVLSEGVEQFLNLAPMATAHMENMDNPHNVTKETLGLENVTNDRQAKASDFSSHKEAPELDHPAKSVTGGKLADGAVTTRVLAQKAVTAEKLAPDAVDASIIKAGSIGYRHMESAVQKDITNKVDKAEGMGLSQNNFTDADRNKLSAIKLTDENGGFEINTEMLVSKEYPVQLYKTQDTYAYYGEETIAKSAGGVYGSERDEENGEYILAYKNKSGYYECRWIDMTGKLLTVVLPKETVSVSFYNNLLFFAVREENGAITVKKRSNGASTPAVVGTFTLGQTGDIEIKKVYSDAYSTGGGYVCIVYYVYSATKTTLVVERFVTGQETSVWSYTKTMREKSDFVPPLSSNDTVYDSRVGMTAMDRDGNLYVSIVSATSGEGNYGIIRLSPEGEVTGQYLPVTAVANTQIYQDIAVLDNKLYAFSTTSIVMVDLETEKRYVIWKGKSACLRGLCVTVDGLHIATEASDGTTKLYFVKGGMRLNLLQTERAEAGALVIPGQYSLCCYMAGKLYLVYQDAETQDLKAKIYVPCALCTVV